MEREITKISHESNSAPLARQKENRKIRVGAYCRVSTIQDTQELSFEGQCEYYRELIESNEDMELVDVYGDQGLSGLHAKKRPEFLRMIADCESGKIDIIYTKSVSRFARNVKECLEYANRLKAVGVPIIFEKEGINTGSDDNNIFFQVMAILAQEESNSLSQAHNWACEYRAKLGDPMRAACYGYIRDKQKKNGIHEWSVIPEEAEIVKKGFELRLEGYSPNNIAAALNEMERARGGTRNWNRNMVSLMLKNEAYAGDILTAKTITTDLITRKTKKNDGEKPQYLIEDHHPAIISREVFEAVQSVRTNRHLKIS